MRAIYDELRGSSATWSRIHPVVGALVLGMVLTLLRSPAAAATAVVVAGEASAQASVTNRVEAWLAEHGHEVMKTGLPANTVTSLTACLRTGDEPCARKVFDGAATPSLIFVRAARKEGTTRADNTLEIVGYWFDRGRDPVASRGYCERCSEQSLRVQIDGMMTALSSSRILDTGNLKVTSRPAGAKIAIDGNVVGVTPLDQVLPVGPHQLTITSDGHKPEVRDVTVRTGQTSTIDVPFEAGQPPPQGLPRDRQPDPPIVDAGTDQPSRALPFALLGAGGAALATGITLFLLDEDPVSSRDQDAKRRYRDTALPGLGLAIGGVVTAGIGGYLLWRTSSKSPSAVIAPLQGGALIGVTKSF